MYIALPLFYTYGVNTSMLSSSIISYLLPPYRKHSSTAQSTRTSSKASTRRSERHNASRQSWLEPACRRAFISYSSLCSQNERRHQNLPGLQNHQTIHKASFVVGADALRVCLLSWISKLDFFRHDHRRKSR